ncbi:peptidylglycine alpha-hydroxylating monooxygenase [Parasteatoda tepidariorum]|uniref:peptidylglycine alpha-hydroxylating monooxygenase n=1 Tax=Parasteatoda tepidariorum TaxID=114398 RepID=UPI00077FD4B1|nr:peptidylglycine alpha-hydroxylating monooxygenase [Parasteatoda tepidariorum]
MKLLSVIYAVKIIFSILYLTTARQVKPNDDGRKYLPLLMPDVQPVVKETYLCTAFRMPQTDFKYIVEFTPNASMHVAHHILIYGCEIPGRWERDTPRLVWECGEMSGSKNSYIQGPTCNTGSQIIYAWAKDAPPLSLPDGVAFKVGRNTGINFLVLQVHYAHVEKFIMGGKDNSGIILTMLPSTTDKVTKAAGVYVLGTGGEIRAGEEEHFETACKINEPLKLHPFAFRTHTHALGKVVSGYKIDKEGKWHFIGKHDPQEPQMFYPVEDKSLTIEYGDVVAARCTMYNFRDRDTYIGSTGEDEMCNFYMMYYVDGDKPMEEKYCFTSGPPVYYWSRDFKVGSVPKNIDLSASTI